MYMIYIHDGLECRFFKGEIPSLLPADKVEEI